MLLPQEFSSERLIYSLPKLTDAEAMFNGWLKFPEVTKFMSFPTNNTVQDTLNYLTYVTEASKQGKDYCYIIKEKSSQKIIGSTGARLVDTVEVVTGYILAKDFWGKGYATETTLAIVQEIKKVSKLKITAAVHPENTASKKVLVKAGFILDNNQEHTAVYPNISAEQLETLMFKI